MSAGQTGATLSPVHVPDLRPAADAAALRRQAEPVMPVAGPPAAIFPPVMPPSAVALGEVGRSMIAATSLAEGGAQGGDERRLKPWGVAMLPHERPEPAPDRGAPGRDAPRPEAVTATPDRPQDRPAPPMPAGRQDSPAAAGANPAQEPRRDAARPGLDEGTTGPSADRTA
jgi:hypothetical protein